MPRLNKHGAWHGSARLMAWEVMTILRSCGRKHVSFVKTSPAVRIVHRLLVEAGVKVSQRQVGEVLYQWQKGLGKINHFPTCQ